MHRPFISLTCQSSGHLFSSISNNLNVGFICKLYLDIEYYYMKENPLWFFIYQSVLQSHCDSIPRDLSSQIIFLNNNFFNFFEFLYWSFPLSSATSCSCFYPSPSKVSCKANIFLTYLPLFLNENQPCQGLDKSSTSLIKKSSNKKLRQIASMYHI